MLEFIRKSFRPVFTIFLWVILVVFAICGGIISHSFGGQIDFIPTVVLIIIGVAVGLFIGFITVIIGGGLVAIPLNVDRGIENIEKMLKLLAGEMEKQTSLDEHKAELLRLLVEEQKKQTSINENIEKMLKFLVEEKEKQTSLDEHKAELLRKLVKENEKQTLSAEHKDKLIDKMENEKEKENILNFLKLAGKFIFATTLGVSIPD